MCPGTPRWMKRSDSTSITSIALQPPGHADRQALVRELVDHVEHPVLPSVVRAIFDEVVRPHVIAMLRPEPEARAISQPKPAALELFGRNLQPLSSPDPLDPLVIDDPPRRRPLAERQLRNEAVMSTRGTDASCQKLPLRQESLKFAVCGIASHAGFMPQSIISMPSRSELSVVA